LDELLTDGPGKVALLGVPLGRGSVTPGQCDLGPIAFRKALKRISTYDVNTETDLAGMVIHDAGDLDIADLLPAQAHGPIIKRFTPLIRSHELSILMGGNNAVTRAGVHSVDPSLKSVGLLTLDAHFDLRPLDNGLMNGNPVSALLRDGLAGSSIAQIGIAPFANSKAMHDQAKAENISVYTLHQCRKEGLSGIIDQALKTLSARCDHIYVDFDIDVIERGLSPGAPGGRAGGIRPDEFFDAARQISAHPKVAAVDLTEFDPSLDINSTTALIAARWMAEILMGYATRGKTGV
jgi:formiminoglutamase